MTADIEVLGMATSICEDLFYSSQIGGDDPLARDLLDARDTLQRITQAMEVKGLGLVDTCGHVCVSKS